MGLGLNPINMSLQEKKHQNKKTSDLIHPKPYIVLQVLSDASHDQYKCTFFPLIGCMSAQ